MNLQAYLHRINYRGEQTPTAATLCQLHRAHLLAAPFENLDIHLGRPIVLDQDALFDKIVRRRRGGFCYELNGLFALLLRELGFEVDAALRRRGARRRRLWARVRSPDAAGRIQLKRRRTIHNLQSGWPMSALAIRFASRYALSKRSSRSRMIAPTALIAMASTIRSCSAMLKAGRHNIASRSSRIRRPSTPICVDITKLRPRRASPASAFARWLRPLAGSR